MPELPDVEVFRKYFDANALDQVIDHVWADRSILEGVSENMLVSVLAGNTFRRSQRHGKHLFAAISSGKWIAMHFGMTGFLKYYKEEAQQPSHVRVRISFANGNHLAYDSRRKLGRIRVTDAPEQFIVEKDLGPDAISGEMTLERFKQRLTSRKGILKAILMNQSVVAGIGNVYADEILYQARLDPRKKMHDLCDDDFKRLFVAMRKVFNTAISAEANPEKMPDDFLLKIRRTDASCPCGGKMEKITISGRIGYFCPECQE